MRIGIFGPGAIGGLFAALLRSNELYIFARGATEGELKSGLIMHTPEGELIHVLPTEYKLSCNPGELDVALICGKSSSTSELADMVKEYLSDEGIAFSVQNGLGHSEVLAARLGWQRVLSASTIHASTRLGLNEVQWTGRGEISIGGLHSESPRLADPRVSSLLRCFKDAQLEPVWCDDIEQGLWIKLLLNIAINPLAAISGQENGEILRSESLLEQAIAIMDEGRKVAIAEGITIESEEMIGRLLQVLESTANNRCSMLQDIMAGRSTEINSLCGEVVRRAEKHGIPTPLNLQLMSLVSAIER